jgi:hypothetical protein
VLSSCINYNTNRIKQVGDMSASFNNGAVEYFDDAVCFLSEL